MTRYELISLFVYEPLSAIAHEVWRIALLVRESGCRTLLEGNIHKIMQH